MEPAYLKTSERAEELRRDLKIALEQRDALARTLNLVLEDLLKLYTSYTQCRADKDQLRALFEGDRVEW